MTIHDKELDAPFETFFFEGETYHNVGLMQAWVRGYTDPEVWMFTEPPAWRPEFLAWLEEHGCRIDELFVGPPVIVFPSLMTAKAFKKEWHDKGRQRYPGDPD